MNCCLNCIKLSNDENKTSAYISACMTVASDMQPCVLLRLCSSLGQSMFTVIHFCDNFTFSFCLVFLCSELQLLAAIQNKDVLFIHPFIYLHGNLAFLEKR